MTAFYMDHQNHGTHICYSRQDVADHEKLGWVLRKEPETEAPTASPAELAAHLAVVRRPGRTRKE